MDSQSSKKSKIKEGYKTASYYARAIMIGFVLWFAIIIAISFGPSLAYMGRPSEIIVSLLLLAGCLIAGFYINKWTAKYMIGNKI
jgi:hypothetical protein